MKELTGWRKTVWIASWVVIVICALILVGLVATKP